MYEGPLKSSRTIQLLVGLCTNAQPESINEGESVWVGGGERRGYVFVKIPTAPKYIKMVFFNT